MEILFGKLRSKREKAVVKVVKSDPPRQHTPSLVEHRAGIRYSG